MLPAQRFALPALGRAAERRPTGKRLRRRKLLGIAPESPASGARFVGRFLSDTYFFSKTRSICGDSSNPSIMTSNFPFSSHCFNRFCFRLEYFRAIFHTCTKISSFSKNHQIWCLSKIGESPVNKKVRLLKILYDIFSNPFIIRFLNWFKKTVNAVYCKCSSC